MVDCPERELGERFIWAAFEDGAVVFDRFTGDTHALDEVHSAALIQHLEASSDLASSAAKGSRLDPATEHLRSLGLV